jgi:hypothetical protein
VPGVAYHKSGDNPYYCGLSKMATGVPEPGDEQVDEWPRDRLIRMDNHFRERLLRAFKRKKGAA